MFCIPLIPFLVSVGFVPQGSIGLSVKICHAEAILFRCQQAMVIRIGAGIIVEVAIALPLFMRYFRGAHIGAHIEQFQLNMTTYDPTLYIFYKLWPTHKYLGCACFRGPLAWCVDDVNHFPLDGMLPVFFEGDTAMAKCIVIETVYTRKLYPYRRATKRFSVAFFKKPEWSRVWRFNIPIKNKWSVSAALAILREANAIDFLAAQEAVKEKDFDYVQFIGHNQN